MLTWKRRVKEICVQRSPVLYQGLDDGCTSVTAGCEVCNTVLTESLCAPRCSETRGWWFTPSDSFGWNIPVNSGIKEQRVQQVYNKQIWDRLRSYLESQWQKIGWRRAVFLALFLPVTSQYISWDVCSSFKMINWSLSFSIRDAGIMFGCVNSYPQSSGLSGPFV